MKKAAFVLMHNKVNGLLHYRSVQTKPVGTSSLHWFACMCVCEAALHEISAEKMTETELALTESQNV